jgi:general secretion pathway protein I
MAMPRYCRSLSFLVPYGLFSCVLCKKMSCEKQLHPSRGYWKESRPSSRLPGLGNKQAFTLLEVMIAVSIIAIALVALFGSQSRSLSHATEAHFNIVAPMLASGKLAELESGNVASDNDEGDFGDEFPGYSWKIETENATFDSPEALANLEKPLQKVELTVLWSETKFSYSLTYYGRWQE